MKDVDTDVIMEDSVDGPPPATAVAVVSSSSGNIGGGPVTIIVTATPSSAATLASVSTSTSVSTGTSTCTPTNVIVETPPQTPPTGTVKKQLKTPGKKTVTGYILYSGDIRKTITSSNPDCNFGEVSRLVGTEWRKLPASEKAMWEERANRLNDETNNKSDESHLPTPSSVTETVFECGWENCDWQFEDVQDAIDHAISDGVGHVYQHFQGLNPPDIEYQCQWRGCTRTRKTIPPFPNLQRLARHVREVHLLKSTGRAVTLENRSKHYLPSTRKAAALKAMSASPKPAAIAGLSSNHARNTPSPMSQNGSLGANGKASEPLFVTVPPRPQRLLHSEAYIKYIEGLTPENRNICNWDKQLRATQASIENVDASKLPAHWLGNRAAVGNHGNVLNALWTLRDFMFKDALGISKHL